MVPGFGRVWLGAVESHRGDRGVPLPLLPLSRYAGHHSSHFSSPGPSSVGMKHQWLAFHAPSFCGFYRRAHVGPFRHQDALSTVTLTTTLYFLSVGFSLLDILYKWKLALCSLRLASFTWCSIFFKKAFSPLLIYPQISLECLLLCPGWAVWKKASRLSLWSLGELDHRYFTIDGCLRMSSTPFNLETRMQKGRVTSPESQNGGAGQGQGGDQPSWLSQHPCCPLQPTQSEQLGSSHCRSSTVFPNI